jgi:5'-methylthioadenosine phosphorylase
MDDFIDFTRNRHLTFFEDGSEWAHTDFSQPYSHTLRTAIMKAADSGGLSIHTRCTYLCVDGPRFESPAEVRLFASWGADVVGMTGLPEAIFAREANINYAAVGIVTNLAAGLSGQPVSHAEVMQVMALQVPVVRELLLETCAVIRRQQDS